MKYFNNCHTLDELKKEYRRLAMQNHPDRGGDAEIMKAINNEYEQMHAILQKQHNASADEFHQSTESPNEFIDIINILVKLHGLDIELCGQWLWIGGNTRENKDALKAAGCRWSNNKKLWYWHHEEANRRHYRGSSTMGQIRTKYGSQTITASGETYDHSRCPVAV